MPKVTQPHSRGMTSLSFAAESGAYDANLRGAQVKAIETVTQFFAFL
jgi:hypothetical protein